MSQPQKTGEHPPATPSEAVDYSAVPQAQTPRLDAGGTIDFSEPEPADPTATVDLNTDAKLLDVPEQAPSGALAATFDSGAGAEPESDFISDGSPDVGGKTLLAAGGAGGSAGSGRERPAVSGYEILGELGRGGMGVVYKALQIKLNRIVALKMVLAGAHASKDQLDRFNTEAQAVAHLQHPNIIQIYEVGEHAGLPYFSLEFVDGGALSDKTAGKPQEPLEAADMIERLARAMQHAHEYGIVHRDLKPMNVLLTRDGTPKITDFGLAKRLEGESSSQTRSGAILGTPSYMAPEQAMGEIEKIGPLTDVYALGAMLYELITGRPPFLAATPMDTVIQVTKDEPVPPAQLQPKLPRDLETICLKCLQKEQSKRYVSAGELADDLQRFRLGEPILARPVSTPERLWRWCRRNPRIAMLSAAVLALLLLVAVGASVAAIQISKQRDLAVNAQRLAETNERIARTAQHEAEIARHEADENAKVAIDQGSLAVNTLYNVVTKVGNQLRGEPAQQKLRKDVLEDAFKGLEKVVARSHTSSLVNRTRAAAYQRRGDIALELGDSETALQNYRESQALVEAAWSAKPNDPVSMFNLAVALEKLGAVSHQLEDLTVARDYFRRCLELRSRLSQMTLGDPNEPELTPDRVKESLVTSYLREADLSLMLGDPVIAWRSLAQHVELQEDRRFADPRDVFAAADSLKKKYRVSFWLKIGELSLHLGDEKTCRDFYDKAVQLSQGAVQRDAKNLQFKQALSSSLAAMGDLELQFGDPAKALQSYDAAHKILQELAGNSPEASVRRVFSLSFYRLGTAHLLTGNAVEAKSNYEESLKLRQELAEADPRNSYKQIDLMVALARCGQHVEAAEIAGRLRERGARDPSVLFYVSCGYALCAAALPMAENGSTADNALREQYIGQAVDSIRQAVAAGYRDHVVLEHDPDLLPIRRQASFQAVVSELKRR
jgi:serine/threonine-protein kinase